MKRACHVIAIVAAAAILIAGASAPGLAGGFSRHHGHHFGHGGHGGHGGHRSLHGHGAGAAVILGLGLLTLPAIQRPAHYDDPYAYRYRYPRYDPYAYRYRYPRYDRYRYRRSDVRPGRTIYAPPRRLQPRVARLAPRARPRAPAHRQFPAGCLMIREYQPRLRVGGREVEAYGDICLRPDGSWLRGAPKLAPR